MKKSCFFIFTALLTAFIFTAFSFLSKPTMKTRKEGNREIIDQSEDGKPVYRLVYTYENGKKIKGEYWEYIDPKKKKDKKPESNIFSGTAMAKKYEALLSDKKIIDDSGIELNIEKDGFTLKFVKIIKYNSKGLPETVITRGYTAYPVLGSFNLKTDYKYAYDNNGRLTEISEKNINVDSLLLNLGVGNSTKIERDGKGRPTKVIKQIDAAPPVFETTIYTYPGDTPNMQKTVYTKCGLDTTKLAVTPAETITTQYGKDVPWEGQKKYDFSVTSFGKIITGFSVYDEVAKKQKLDGSKFMSMSWIDKGMYLKNVASYYKNEQKGPKWRMGELPDVPDPFMIYKEQTWW